MKNAYTSRIEDIVREIGPAETIEAIKDFCMLQVKDSQYGDDLESAGRWEDIATLLQKAEDEATNYEKDGLLEM
jgi:hypothetical protein